MEIIWPGSYCNDANTIPHYLTNIDRVGEFWRCIKCKAIKWHPTHPKDIVRYAKLKGKYDIAEAHSRMIMRDEARLRHYLAIVRPRVTMSELNVIRRALPAEVYDRMVAALNSPKATVQVPDDLESNKDLDEIKLR